MNIKTPSKAEEMVMLAIWRLKEKAYGVPIRRQILKDTGLDYTYGTLYGLLRQMASKGFIQKRMGAPLPRKGGRRRTYFELTPAGKESLKESIRLHRRLWGDLGEYSFDKP